MSEKRRRGRPPKSKEQRIEEAKRQYQKSMEELQLPPYHGLMTDCSSTQVQTPMPTTFNPPLKLDFKEVANNERYQIKDAVIRDVNDNAICTLSMTILDKRAETRGHLHKDTDETYYFLTDRVKGTMILGESAIQVQGNNYDTVYVPRGTFHKVINPNHFIRMGFMTISPGETQRPTMTQAEAFTEKRTIKREPMRPATVDQQRHLLSL